MKIKSQAGPRDVVSTAPLGGASGDAPVEPATAIPPVEGLRGSELSTTRDRLERIGEQLNEFVQENGRELEFQVREERGDVVIIVRQSTSGEVIRTIPPEEAQRLVGELEQDGGLLLSQLA